MEPCEDRLGLAGKNVVVLGVADEASIAWGIALAYADRGARVTIGYQQKFFSRVRLLLKQRFDISGARCDVLNPDELTSFFAPFQQPGIDVLVHSIAYAPPEAFTRDPSQVSTEAADQTVDVSALSLLRVVRVAKPALRPWGSVMAMTFQAANRAFPPYGMMGVAKSTLESIIRYLSLELGKNRIRVNAISPGPIETLAAYGEVLAVSSDPRAIENIRGNLIKDVIAAGAEVEGLQDRSIEWVRALENHLRQAFAARCAIEETVSKEDVAGCALFLGSGLSTKITGQVIHVDAGLSSSLII